LQFLRCSHTQVSDLKPLIGLASLQYLTANGCHLSDMPRNLVLHETLRAIILHHTTVPGIPAEFLSPDDYSSCLKVLCHHLMDLEAGTEDVREAKLMVLGNGRVGKTQICRRLRGLQYDETVPSTHGIAVTAEPWVGSTDDEALNIWDFGGQDIYHGAHTLFMETSAVFMIVWHPDFETAGDQPVDGMVFRNYPLPYWLDYVRTLGRKDSPVVVVQSRCDRPEQESSRLPADDASRQFRSLKPCWYSARTCRGGGALEEALRDAVQFLRERDGIATIGAGRMRVLRQLEAWRNDDQGRPTAERQHRTLSQTEFRTLCEQVGGVSSPPSLLTYLHNRGVVFYKPALFHDRIILDQSWALEAVYGVFDRHKAYPLILSQGGRFTRSLLAMTAWRAYSEPEQRLFLSLMESCGIAFVDRQADSRLGLETSYVAPDLLPDKEAVAPQLAGRWDDDEENWRLEYVYPFLHPGLMRALLCDVGHRSHEAGVYWKYGVWVYEKSTGCRALLEQQMADERRGRITLRVQGRRHEALVHWLQERIQERNRLFGYPDLLPVVDDFGLVLRRQEHGDAPFAGIAGYRRGGPTSLAAQDHSGAVEAAPTPTEPIFDKLPEALFPPREPQVFVSYAWGDDTPAGRQRAQVVDDLCARLGQQGVHVCRDRDEMRPGDLISEFMDRLAAGDCVLAVISDKYLQSEYCMNELFRIYRNCADKPDRFLGKVVPLILPDARLDSLAKRLQRAIYWTRQEEELQPLVAGNVGTVGTEFFRKFKLIGEFARNTSNMLEYLMDKLQPRDFERQAEEGFTEVLSQIGQTR
jgi:internalin A